MIKIDRSMFKDIAIKEEKIDIIESYVIHVIRNTELTNLLNKKDFKKNREILENTHVGIDAMTCEKKIIIQELGKKSKQFLKDREEIENLKIECKKYSSLISDKSLELIDRVHITLIAHSIYKPVVLDDDVFYKEKGGIDISNIVHLCHQNGKIRDIKGYLSAIFNILFNIEGEYFNKLKIRRSDLSNYLLIIFCNEINKKSSMNWKHKVFTSLCAEVLYNKALSYRPVHCEGIKIEPSMNSHVISMTDLVIKCNVFACLDRSHKILDISAIVNVLTEGEVSSMTIPAGYCPQCRVYFILKSVWQELKMKGILLCRIIEEKTYKCSESKKHMNLAQESLLMQYGYNVSQSKALTDTERQIILSLIIDNNIMTKSEIISYFDFFISQRNRMESMKKAISKWKKDKIYVENYKHDDYEIVHINLE